MPSFYAEGYLKDLPTWLEFQCLLQYTLVIFAHIYSAILVLKNVRGTTSQKPKRPPLPPITTTKHKMSHIMFLY